MAIKKKTIIIICAVAAVAVGVAAYIDSIDLDKMRQGAEATWPGKSQYATRLAKIDKLKTDLRSAAANVPDIKKLADQLDHDEASLNGATDQGYEIKAINKIEKDTADIIIMTDKTPSLEKMPDIQADVASVSTPESSIWSKKYDDATAFYNISIHRIRHKITMAIFNLRKIVPIANTWEFLKAKGLQK